MLIKFLDNIHSQRYIALVFVISLANWLIAQVPTARESTLMVEAQTKTQLLAIHFISLHMQLSPIMPDDHTMYPIKITDGCNSTRRNLI